MYGAAGVNASLAHEPLRLNIICTSQVRTLQECAENWAKSATTCSNSFLGRRHAPRTGAACERRERSKRDRGRGAAV